MEQEPKVNHHLGESTELKGYINGKLSYHDTFKKQHVSLASLLHQSHNKNIKKANKNLLQIQNEISDSESSIDEAAKKKLHKATGSMSAKDIKAQLGIEYNDLNEINEEESDSITKASEEVSLDDISSPPPERHIIDHGSSQKAIHTIETEHEVVHYI